MTEKLILRTDCAYDIFRHDEGIELVAWKNMTERAEPVTAPNPGPVLRASTGQAYLGTLAPSIIAGSADAKYPVFNYKFQQGTGVSPNHE